MNKIETYLKKHRIGTDRYNSLKSAYIASFYFLNGAWFDRSRLETSLYVNGKLAIQYNFYD